MQTNQGTWRCNQHILASVRTRKLANNGVIDTCVSWKLAKFSEELMALYILLLGSFLLSFGAVGERLDLWYSLLHLIRLAGSPRERSKKTWEECVEAETSYQVL